MPYEESFDIIAFHSRQHAFYFNRILKERGYTSMLMSTPKEVAIGCGLSIRYSTYLRQQVIELFAKHSRPVVGFFHIERMGNKSTITRIPYK